jgi:hypothetical protein
MSSAQNSDEYIGAHDFTLAIKKNNGNVLWRMVTPNDDVDEVPLYKSGEGTQKFKLGLVGAGNAEGIELEYVNYRFRVLE